MVIWATRASLQKEMNTINCILEKFVKIKQLLGLLLHMTKMFHIFEHLVYYRSGKCYFVIVNGL